MGKREAEETCNENAEPGRIVDHAGKNMAHGPQFRALVSPLFIFYLILSRISLNHADLSLLLFLVFILSSPQSRVPLSAILVFPLSLSPHSLSILFRGIITIYPNLSPDLEIYPNLLKPRDLPQPLKKLVRSTQLLTWHRRRIHGRG